MLRALSSTAAIDLVALSPRRRCGGSSSSSRANARVRERLESGDEVVAIEGHAALSRSASGCASCLKSFWRPVQIVIPRADDLVRVRRVVAAAAAQDEQGEDGGAANASPPPTHACI